MAEENKDKLSVENENNYGFPFVEVTPLEENSKKNTFSYEDREKEKKSVMTEEKPALIKENKQSSVLVKKKRSQLPLQLSLVMIILIILSVMAYFLYFLPENEEDQFEQATIPPKVELEEAINEVVPELPMESQKEEGENNEQVEENVEEVAEVVKEEPASVSIAPVQTGNINKVTSKSGAPEYFIIVSSTVSEKVALEEAQKLIDKNNEVWLIYPYGETTNFRLAIGKYSAFAEATKALEKRKADFDASIWILKY